MRDTFESAEVLQVDNLSIRFGGLKAVDGMSFSVIDGEVLSLIGPNGAGKTTAFNAITGYLQPTNGSIRYLGQQLNGLRTDAIAARGVVRTFQKTSVFAGQTVFDNIMMGLHLTGKQSAVAAMFALPFVAREERALTKRAGEILEFVGLASKQAELGGALPYGEQRLLEVAIALAASPKLLLLDEPVSGMNPSETASFMSLLAEIRKLGITILLVEHDMKMVMGVSDRVICLNQGKIIANETPEGIQRNVEVIKAYLGEGFARAQH